MNNADFKVFFAGYLTGLVFTATIDGSNGDPVFKGDYQEAGNTIKSTLEHEAFAELLGDARDFFNQAYNLIKIDLHQAGVDFHLTRNGHGAGFWDGDWAGVGNKLTELSHPYGTLELTEHDGKLYLHS